jgi:hypothetical protein
VQINHTSLNSATTVKGIYSALALTVPMSIPMHISKAEQDSFIARAAEEWRQISMQRRDEVWTRGWNWLQKYGHLSCAAEPLIRLLEFKKSVHLVNRAQKWLDKFPDDKQAPNVLAEILNVSANKSCIKLAKSWLERLERDFFCSSAKRSTVKEFDDPRLFLRAALQSTDQGLYRLAASIVKSFPLHDVWMWVFPIRMYKNPNKRIERLTVQWIRLNADNKRIVLFTVCSLTPSDAVTEATFEWILKGGAKNAFMTVALKGVMYNAKQNSRVSLCAIEHCREWLRTHKSHKETGTMHGVLLLTSRSKADADNAYRWYKKHSQMNRADHVIAALLELSYKTSLPLEPSVLEEAKKLLSDQETRIRFPRFIGSLISVHQDAESIAWAKECCTKTRLSWILARLLEAAPDRESIDMAVQSYPDWKNTVNEPMMLCAMLVAQPTNKTFRRRAHYWLRKNPKGEWTTSLQNVLERAERAL